MRNVGISTGALLTVRDNLTKAIPMARESYSLLEVNLHGENFYQWEVLCRGGDLDSEAFDYLSLHAPKTDRHLSEARVLGGLIRFRETYDYVVQHPDLLHSGDWNLLGGQLLIENMDHRKLLGQRPDSLAKLFRKYPRAHFCLDIAHAHYIDASGRLTEELLNAFGHKLRQIHVSVIDEGGQHHSPTTSDLTWINRDLSLVDNLNIPIIWEAYPRPLAV